MKLSVCGLVCDECPYYSKPCKGCREVKGAPFWVEEIESDNCELYHCSSERGFRSCGDCAELPCRSFRQLKDPGISDEEHLMELERRVQRLRKHE